MLKNKFNLYNIIKFKCKINIINNIEFFIVTLAKITGAFINLYLMEEKDLKHPLSKGKSFFLTRLQKGFSILEKSFIVLRQKLVCPRKRLTPLALFRGGNFSINLILV